MVRFVFLILINLVADIMSANLQDMTYIRLKVTDLKRIKYPTSHNLALNEPFLFRIQSEISLINHTLSCYTKLYPRETFVNKVHFIEKQKGLFDSKQYFEATAVMQTLWECKLECTLSNTTIQFRLDVKVLGILTPQSMFPAGPYQKENAYDYSPTSYNQGYNYNIDQIDKIKKHIGKELNTNIKHDVATDNEDRIAMLPEQPPNQFSGGSYQRGNTYNYNTNSNDQRYNYGHQNNEIVKGIENEQSFPLLYVAGTGNEIYRQTMQADPLPTQEKQDTSSNYTLLIAIISVIALVQTFLIAGYFVHKRLCGSKQSVQEPGRQDEGSSEHQYEELNYRTTIVERPQYPPPQDSEDNIKYMHYNSPYDHMISRSTTRQCRTGLPRAL